MSDLQFLQNQCTRTNIHLALEEYGTEQTYFVFMSNEEGNSCILFYNHFTMDTLLFNVAIGLLHCLIFSFYAQNEEEQETVLISDK